MNPVNVLNTLAKVLAEDKGVAARRGLKEAGVQVSEERDAEPMSRRTEMSYKAQSAGKLAQHNEAQDSADRVNDAPGVSQARLPAQHNESERRSENAACH